MMVSSDMVPYAMRDKVMEAYEIPLIGRVEIRQDIKTNAFYGHIEHFGVLPRPFPESLEDTRAHACEWARKLLSTKHVCAKKEYERVAVPFDDLESRARSDPKSWMVVYKK